MNLLYVDRPLVINPALAEKIGLNEAIILQQLNYWLTRTESGVLKNGKVWIYNTYAEWHEQVPFFSERTIQRIMLKLERVGVVESEMLNKSKGDRTKFYTINQDHDLLKSSCQSGTTIAPYWHHHSAKLAPSSCQSGTLSTETTTEITTYTYAQSALPAIEQPKQAKPKKQKLTADDLFNEFKNHWPLIAQCDDEILRAWCQVRIDKKAAHTELAHKAIEHELEILIHHGLTVTQAVREAAANGWKGLKASWYDVVKYAGNAKPADNYRTADGAIERLNDTSWTK